MSDENQINENEDLNESHRGSPTPSMSPTECKVQYTVLKKPMDLCLKSCSTARAFSKVTEKFVSKNYIAISILNKLSFDKDSNIQ